VSSASGAHRIGPNAVTRVADALREHLDEKEVARLFELAGIVQYLDDPPQQMVDEREVTRLHQVLRSQLGLPEALQISRMAGVLTGDYLLAHRIPSGVQTLLSFLPARLASRVLIGAIQRHSWTFSGSGELRAKKSFPPELAIAGCCICRGARMEESICDYYAAAIERLFRVLVHPGSTVSEAHCQATGADACVFRINWSDVPGSVEKVQW
jgi:divinyl protochlorophyllide a 8-vinyl-reductase